MLGDPDRVQKIASHWNTAREISVHNEFHSCTGRFETGTGGESVIKVANEAVNILRLGSAEEGEEQALALSFTSANEATLRED